MVYRPCSHSGDCGCFPIYDRVNKHKHSALINRVPSSCGVQRWNLESSCRSEGGPRAITCRARTAALAALPTDLYIHSYIPDGDTYDGEVSFDHEVLWKRGISEE